MEKAVIYCYHGALMFLLAIIRSVVVRVKVCCYRIAGGKEGAEKNSARICYPPLLRTNNQFSVELVLVPCDWFLPTEVTKQWWFIVCCTGLPFVLSYYWPAAVCKCFHFQ